MIRLMAIAVALLVQAPAAHTDAIPIAALTSKVARSITTFEARRMSQDALAHKVLSLAADKVVDSEGLPFSDTFGGQNEPLSSLNLALVPKPGWNGVCSAAVIRLDFEQVSQMADRGANTPLNVSDVDTWSLFKVRGNLDPNKEQDDAAFAIRCARDHPFQDGYFTAPDPRTAQEAGLILESIQQQARARKIQFELSCEILGDCATASKLIASVSTGQLSLVNVPSNCARGRECLELAYLTHEGCSRKLNVAVRYHGVGKKGWGFVQVDRVRVDHEECHRVRG